MLYLVPPPQSNSLPIFRDRITIVGCETIVDPTKRGVGISCGGCHEFVGDFVYHLGPENLLRTN